MKKVLCFTIAMILSFYFLGMAIAEETTTNDGVNIKQGMLYTKDGTSRNTTMATIIKTDAAEAPLNHWPKWSQALLDGWVFDAGAAYEDNVVKDASLMVGRELGTLGKYVPWIKFPFKDRIEISIYPAGIYLPDVSDHFKPEWCWGFGYIKGTIRFK